MKPDFIFVLLKLIFEKSVTAVADHAPDATDVFSLPCSGNAHIARKTLAPVIVRFNFVLELRPQAFLSKSALEDVCIQPATLLVHTCVADVAVDDRVERIIVNK